MFVEEYLVELRQSGFRPSAWARYAARCLKLARESAFGRPVMLRSIALVGIVGFLALLAASLVLAFTTEAGLAFQVFTQCGLVLLLGVAAAAGHVRLLVRPDGTPIDRFNPANILTLSRLVLIPAMLAFVAHGHLALALVTYLVGGLTDVLDGWLARRRGDATDFGRMFDPVVDILFNMALFLSLFAAGLLPAWVLALIMTRYGLLLGGAVVIYLFRGPVHIRPTVLGKTTGVVMTLLVGTLIGGRMLLPAEEFHQVEGLLVAAIGFVEAITIPQVLTIGWYNFRRAAPVR